MKDVRIRNTSPSLGRLQRSRQRFVHKSTPTYVDETGAHLDFRKGNGITYRKPQP